VEGNVITSPSFFSEGTVTVTATARNGCGSVTKSFTVTVVNKTVPVPYEVTLPDLTGNCAVKITHAPEGYDGCTGSNITATTTDPLEYTAQGTYTVTWTYRDESGNTSTQTQKVVVKDRTAPVPVVATLPEATGECSVTATAPRATDLCQGSITATTADPITYTTQGTFVIHWRYDDGRGNVTEQPQTVIVKDVTNPALTAPAALTLTNDPGQCGRSLAGVSLGTPVASDNCGGVKPATHDAPAFFPAGTTTVTWTVEDAAGNRSTATQRVTVVNADPVVGTLTAPVSPVGINTAVAASATFTDNNLTEATWDWGNGTTAGTIDQANGKITGSRTYSTPGVHTVTLTVTDACGKTAASTFRYVVVYDPNGGFVTGGGWIHSPTNAYSLNPAATGTARFGFVSRYQKGSTQPVGTTGFEFEAAGLAFHSTSYEWLVVAGTQAQYKGAGTLNGELGYKFILTASDAQANGGGGVDRFRIKIWKDGETVPVYDNQRGAADDATATTAIGGGSIMVHDDRSKARESAEVRAETPVAAATLRSFPNPFTDKTTIEFTLGRDEAYSLDVYDLNGRLVDKLGTATAVAGKTNRTVWEAKTAPSGMYFARLTTSSGVQHLKLVLK
jgi:PKD repeat protein